MSILISRVLNVTVLVWVLSTALGVPSSRASEMPWHFRPSKVGRALHEGGWTVEYSLGQINASPEFSFPLQLIYLNNRERQGMFGSQWWCPQLESTVLPRGRGVVVWTMPSGGMVGFREDPKRASDYRSFDGNWRARVIGGRVTIFNAEGWQYSYNRGRMESVTSPTGRILEVGWSGERFNGMQLRDSLTAARQVLIRTGYGENRCLAVLEVGGKQHRFGYAKDGKDDRLAGWAPPSGRPVRFAYHQQSGVLTHAILGDGKDPADVSEFKTEFAQRFEGDKPANDPNARKKPGNWWLVADRDFTYAYGREGKNGEKWKSDQITVTGRTGLKKEVEMAANRGIVTAKPDSGPEQKTYFYKAPGQRYDGKLRRIEEGGRLVAEYRYDRKTGLLTELHDANGIITFFDYDPKWRPARRELWEPKPIRVRKGTRRSWEVVGEFAYDDDGRLVAAKDAAGQLTRYAYNNRGELAAVTDPEGGTVQMTYDPLGRRTSVSKDGLKESVEYDSEGRIKARTAADGTRTEFVFDKQGQVQAVKQNGETAIEYVRNELGQIAGEKDPLGRIRKVERDARGSLLAEYAPNGSVTRYEYDEFNRRTAQIDGNGNKITFSYDAMGRLIKQANPLGGTLTWKFDDKGRVIERTNGEQTIRHAYDDAGRLTSLDYGGGQKIDYTHDKEGRILSAKTPDTNFEYTYDKLGRIETLSLQHGEEDQLIRYSHNSRGQRTALVLSELVPAVPTKGNIAGKPARYEVIQQTHYAYEVGGRLSSIVTNGYPAIAYRYDSAGRVTQKLYGGDKPSNASVVANIGYDPRGRLAKVEFSGTKIGSPLLLAYEWDPASQLTRRSWNGETQRYVYDPSGQLLKVLDDATGKEIESYRYDSAGNMLEKVIGGQRTAMTYNAANQLAKVFELPASLPDPAASPAETDLEKLAREVLTYSYDKAGRMLGPEGGNSSQYGWLDKVTRLTQPDGTSVNFTYWPDGQLARTEKQTDPQISQRNADSFQQVSHSSQKSDSFLWDGLALLKRNDTVYIIEPHPSGGIPIASHPVGRPDKITWHLNDLLGTTLATLDGGVTRFTKLTAFGQPLKLAANVPSAPALTEPASLPTVPETQAIQQTTISN